MAVKHGKTTRVLLDDQHLSGRLNESSVSASKEVNEKTAYGDDNKKYVAGLRDATASLSGYFDGSTDEIHAKLSSLATDDASKPLTWGMGALAVGEFASLFDAHQVSYDVTSPVGNVVSVSVEAQSTEGIDYGVALANHSSRTSSGNESSVDQSSSSSNGAVAHLHVTAVSGSSPTADVVVQESSDNTTWVDLITFTQATAETSERKAVTGTVERYVRAEYTLGGTNPDFTFAVAFSRR